MTSSYSTDIVIFGGGIAGLWLLNRLRNQGYQAILLETDKLGSGQTLASQGIIHGGLKYALHGALGGAANVISDMPARWRSCLAGEAEIDLSGCRVLSEHYYMWSDSGFRSKLKTFLGSKSLSGRVTAVEKQDYPDFFKAATVEGTLYKLPDFVVDTNSLLQALVEKQRDWIFRVSPGSYTFERNAAGLVNAISFSDGDTQFTLEAQKFIFSAGKGNQQLIDDASLAEPKCQLRPLNMVYVKGKDLPSAFVHCIGDSFSLTPKLTVTSHSDAKGETVWYLGGEIAESGVGKAPDTQIHSARKLLTTLFPWINFAAMEFHCFAIDRAEANVRSNSRPEDAYFIEESNVLVAWPTKLTLTPNLADNITEHFAASGVVPSGATAQQNLSDVLEAAEIATSRWD
ncbi:MAG: glycerol-3-phosphate dehydrogenase [SAR86 cluster bacterium]|uniref:Glycerol-3-phosphate dehydrogenase n=1 Tax=SAR86 cluster bacterium TaxID=2030880 RepID=A0A2A4WZ44_9GAMM|nr:MAG: glycerol-3-phosphate dehydrogenase [SAR86 cluster bacterium]